MYVHVIAQQKYIFLNAAWSMPVRISHVLLTDLYHENVTDTFLVVSIWYMFATKRAYQRNRKDFVPNSQNFYKFKTTQNKLMYKTYTVQFAVDWAILIAE